MRRSAEAEAAWLIFAGHQMNMTKREILTTRYGEYLDMISLFSVSNGAAREADTAPWSYDEVMELR